MVAKVEPVVEYMFEDFIALLLYVVNISLTS